MGGGNVIYIINESIRCSKTFRPNSKHPSNAEFLIKGVSRSAIKGIIVHEEDFIKIKDKIGILKEQILKDSSLDAEKRNEIVDFLEYLPIVSFEKQMEKEKQIK